MSKIFFFFSFSFFFLCYQTYLVCRYKRILKKKEKKKIHDNINHSTRNKLTESEKQNKIQQYVEFNRTQQNSITVRNGKIQSFYFYFL
jgi:hypothetical protein